MANYSRNRNSSASSSPADSRRASMESLADDQIFPLDLQLMVKGLAPTSNPIVGMFAIDLNSGALNFIEHTELQKSTGAPKFDKRLRLNYYPSRGQKIHLNVYSAPLSDDGADNDICEEDRVGSVIVALDKIPSLQSRLNFVPIKIELPLWHDTDMKLHTALQKQGTAILIEFHAQEGVSTAPLAGPKSEMTYLESIQMMSEGAHFLKYRFSSNGKPQKRFVFYERVDGPMGSLYWCDPDKRKKADDRCIPLHTITGLFEENQTKAFKKFFKKPDPKQLERCFSIVGKERTLDLEADSKTRRDAFMYGIHKVLTNQGGFDIKETDKIDQQRIKVEEEMRRNSIPVRNTFEIKVKLRNLPLMPWAQESSSTSVVLYEKQGQQFVLIDQTDWQKDNAQPNFTKPLLMSYTLPLVPVIVKIVVYDQICDDSHIVGSALVRTDTFQRYAGQEMLIKLKNSANTEIDSQLAVENAYMLVNSLVLQGDVRERGDSGSGQRSNFNDVLGEMQNAIRGGGAGGKGGKGGGTGGYKNTFAKSIATFMGAGESFTLRPVTQGAALPKELTPLKSATPITLFYRASAGDRHEQGHLIVAEKNKRGSDDENVDANGEPLNPLLSIPVVTLREVLTGVHPPHFKGPTPPHHDRCFTVLVKKSSTDDSLLYALDFEARSKSVRDAWSSGISDFIAFVEEQIEADGGDGTKLSFLDETKGKKSAIDAAKKNALKADSNILGEAEDKFGADRKSNKLGLGSFKDNESSDDEDERPSRVAKPKAAPVVLSPVILGDGAIPPPPPMGDVVFGDGAPPPPPMFDIIIGPDGIPLPPPIGPPGAPAFGAAPPVWKGPKLKRLHWDALDGIDVDGTLWGLVQGDLEAEAGSMLEQMFKIADAKKKPEGEEESKEKVKRLYDGKRAQNIEILIKSFRMPALAIQEAIRSMDMSILTQERLQVLLTCCPTQEETATLKAYKKKNPDLDNVGQAELFGYALLEIPKAPMRLRLLLFQTKFDSLIKDMIDTYQRLLTGATLLHDSDRLKKVMQVVLSVGNYLNQSTRKKAKGFKLSALEKLNDTKSMDNKQTLLDFIVDYVDKMKVKEEVEAAPGEAESKEAAVPLKPGEEREPPPSYLASLIPAVHDASLIDWSALNGERENLLTGLNELDKELTSMNKDETIDANDQFKTVMEEFLGHAQRRVAKLKKKYASVAEETDSLIEYFGETSSSLETTELFKIFDRFFNMYKSAEINLFHRAELEAKKERLAKAREEQQRIKEEKARANGTTGETVAQDNKEAPHVFGVKLKSRNSSVSAPDSSAAASNVVATEAINGIVRHGQSDTPTNNNTFGVKLKSRPSEKDEPGAS